MTHHSLHTTHLTPHHLSYRAHLTPLISQHSSYATSLSPVISQHSNMRYSSYTTQLIPNAYSGERHKTSHVGLSGPFIFFSQGKNSVVQIETSYLFSFKKPIFFQVLFWAIDLDPLGFEEFVDASREISFGGRTTVSSAKLLGATYNYILCNKKYI